MHSRRTAIDLFALVVVAGLSVPVSANAQADREIAVSYSLESPTLTLHEPARLIFSLNNNSAQSVRLDLGRDGKEHFKFVLRRPDGSEAQLPGLQPVVGMFKMGRYEVRPGDRLTRTLLLNERTDLAEPGRYEVLVSLPSPVTTREGAELMKVPAHRERFEILPRNAARLTEVCESLLRQIASSPSAVVSEDAALALAHIQDPVAVPYMEKALRTGKTPGTSLVSGLARMGTADAVRALVSVYTDLSSIPTQADSWNRRRANAIRQGLESIEAQTSDAATKAEIRRALGSTSTERR